MKKSAHGNPIFIKNGSVEVIRRVDDLSEAQIQEIVFSYPESLPISDIDESYNPLVPVCMELATNAGPLDVLMATPNGDLIIIETKLWRNPEARRKVVAQILDYAKELSKWSYADLQRELNKKLKRSGNTLYEMMQDAYPNEVLTEMDFVDAVSRNLRIGKFLLIIAGDGIREGAINLSQFITKSGNLNFGLAMLELPIYKNNDNEIIITPKVIVKTVEIEKINIELMEGIQFVGQRESADLNAGTQESSPALEEKRKFFTTFWQELIDEMRFDDPEQEMPSVSKGSNLYIYPGGDINTWISCYFMSSKNRVGVYFRFHNNQKGQLLKDELSPYTESIKEELGDEIEWRWDQDTASAFEVNMSVVDVLDPKDRTAIKRFFAEWSNKFVNVMRPKLQAVE